MTNTGIFYAVWTTGKNKTVELRFSRAQSNGCLMLDCFCVVLSVIIWEYWLVHEPFSVVAGGSDVGLYWLWSWCTGTKNMSVDLEWLLRATTVILLHLICESGLNSVFPVLKWLSLYFLPQLHEADSLQPWTWFCWSFFSIISLQCCLSACSQGICWVLSVILNRIDFNMQVP